MNGFWRVFLLALRYRITLIGVVCTAVLVGFLWSANIGVMYPFITAVVHGKTIPESMQEEIDDLEKMVVQSHAKREALRHAESYVLPAARPAIHKLLLTQEQQYESTISRLDRYQSWMPWVNRFSPTTPFRTVVWLVAALLVGSALKDSLFVANMMLVERLVQLVMFDLRKQFYRQTLRLDAGAFGACSSSELLASFTNDIACLAVGLNSLIGRAVREPLRMLACLIGAAYMSWQLLVFSLLIAPPCLIMMKGLSKSLKRNSRKALAEVAILFNRLTETFAGMQTVKAFTMEQSERARFHDTTKAIYHIYMRVCLYSSLTKPVTELFGVGVVALALVAGSYLVLSGETTIAGIVMCDRPMNSTDLLFFFGMLAGVADPARKLSDIFGVLVSGAAAAERLLPILDREPTIVDPPSPRILPRPHRQVSLENVCFHYHPSQPVLRNVNLSIPFGESIAIVGPNGCGKTSLINLLPRFYDPIEGSVRLDQTDIRELRIRDLRERIGIVSQSTHLFDETVATNIRYGSPHASDEEVERAATQAHAHRFIVEKLDQGYQTRVGTSGSRLSGGQRQRIALARAMLRDPEILILDEATSQIDLESEQLIHQALSEFIRGRTAIMITHRLSTLVLADRIVVMEAGRIADMGTHHQLLSRCSLYQRLQEMQFRQSA